MIKATQVSIEVTNSLANYIALLALILEYIAKALVYSQVPFLRGLQLTLSRKLQWIRFLIVAILSFLGSTRTFARSSIVLLLQFPSFQPKILQLDFVSSPIVLLYLHWLRKLSLLILSNLRLYQKPQLYQVLPRQSLVVLRNLLMRYLKFLLLYPSLDLLYLVKLLLFPY